MHACKLMHCFAFVKIRPWDEHICNAYAKTVNHFYFALCRVNCRGEVLKSLYSYICPCHPLQVLLLPFSDPVSKQGSLSPTQSQNLYFAITRGRRSCAVERWALMTPSCCTGFSCLRPATNKLLLRIIVCFKSVACVLYICYANACYFMWFCFAAAGTWELSC